MGKWRIVRQADHVRGGVNVALVIESENRVEFAFPYQGGSSLRLWLARNAKGGEGVMVELTRGQLLCLRPVLCAALIRIDDRPTERFALGRMEDMSPARLRVVDGDRLMRAMMGARRMAVEVTVYREGAPQFLFDITGFPAAMPDQMP